MKNTKSCQCVLKKKRKKEKCLDDIGSGYSYPHVTYSDGINIKNQI